MNLANASEHKLVYFHIMIFETTSMLWCFHSEYDVDECATNTHNCHPDATCTDTDDSFTCQCNDGLNGDGVLCWGTFNHFEYTFIDANGVCLVLAMDIRSWDHAQMFGTGYGYTELRPCANVWYWLWIYGVETMRKCLVLAMDIRSWDHAQSLSNETVT